MRRTASIIFAAALAFGAVAADDDAETEDLTDHPCYDAEAEALSYPEEQVWFHEGDSKLGNTSVAPWDTTPPETSVQGGAGAGAFSTTAVLLAENTPSATFAGTFEGCIDTLLFDVYSFDPSNRSGTGASGEPAEHNLSLSISVDGNEVFSGGPLVAATTFANEGMGPNLNRFAVNLGDTLELFSQFSDISLDGTHEVEVTIASWFVNTGHSIYVWDTSEVPSGITFNGEVTDDYATLN